MPLGFERPVLRPCRVGTCENSPAFQRWGWLSLRMRPVGTPEKRLIRRSLGLGHVWLRCQPRMLSALRYFHPSLSPRCRAVAAHRDEEPQILVTLERNVRAPHSCCTSCGALAHRALGTTTTPQGPEPALMRAISFSVARSTAETSSDGPLAANRYLPSGESAIPHGRVPTLIVLSTSHVPASSTHTVPPRPVLA